MYSPRIIQRNVERAEAQLGIKLKRYDAPVCCEAREKLDQLRREDGQLKRPLSKTEQAFIKNELLLSKYDFQYWAERYATIPRDAAFGGGLGPSTLWESQLLVLNIIARAEDEEWDKKDRGYNSDGILIHTDKARQEGLTTLARLLTMHRVLLWHNTRAIAASVDDQKIKNLYDADKLIYNCGLEKEEYSSKGGVPFWMRPTLTYDVKDQHIKFNQLNSRVQYEFSTQGSHLGQGSQFDIGHMTELAYWNESILDRMTLDFFPTLPQAPSTLFLSESVAFGRSGWWYQMSKLIREERMPRWRYAFIPWYAIKGKYRSMPPTGWFPDDVTERHADMVWETSPRWFGQRIRLDREQMYWWETKRKEAKELEKLSDHLTNYCATPEEGFQHSNPTAVSHETMERLRAEAESSNPVPYLLRLNNTRSAEDDWTHGKVPTYQIDQDAIVPAHPDELDHDARGFVWIWEPPKRNATYIMAIDPTHGSPLWDRSSRTTDDFETDNAAISILRKADAPEAPDVQVAEFAAPVDQETLGLIANLLGRIYGGATEDGQCICITECHLGLGSVSVRIMLDRGYTNHWMWQKIDRMAVSVTQDIGWSPSPTAVRTLWEKFRRILMLRQLVLRSRWCVEELADCIWDKEKKTAGAISPAHDDRVRAISLACWVARSWGMVPDPVSTTELEHKNATGNWQNRLVSYDQMMIEMNEAYESMFEP